MPTEMKISDWKSTMNPAQKQQWRHVRDRYILIQIANIAKDTNIPTGDRLKAIELLQQWL